MSTMSTMSGISSFAQNLRLLCSEQRSVSEVCRRIGINRQQFARYTSGKAEPSPFNLGRICHFFGVSEQDLHLPHREFALRVPDPRWPRQVETLVGAFPGNARALRRFAGSYHAHYRSPSQPGQVIRALVTIFEQDGLFHSSTIERVRHRETGQLSRARFEGVVSSHDDALFLVERGRISKGGISETILAPVHRGGAAWLSGLVLGFSWRSRMPYASQCVWKRLRPSLGLRPALAACGAFDLASRQIEPFVVDRLGPAPDGAGPGPLIPSS